MSSFRVQFQWLKLMDPSGERMLTLHSALKLRLARETDPLVKDALKGAVDYLEHLSDVVATNGKDKDLRELAERLYGGGRGGGTHAPVSA